MKDKEHKNDWTATFKRLTAQIIKKVWGFNRSVYNITIIIITIKKTIKPNKYIYIYIFVYRQIRAKITWAEKADVDKNVTKTRHSLTEKTQLISTVSISYREDFCVALVGGIIILLQRL